MTTQSQTKMERSYQKKNIYANPINYKLFWWTAFGIYISLNVEHLVEKEKLFLRGRSEEGTSAHQYQEQLLGLIKRKEGTLMNHIRIKHANAYGLRKGSATLFHMISMN